MTATQKNWVDFLDTAQLYYNLHRSSATGMSPFELAMGWQPRTPLDVAKKWVGGDNSSAHRLAIDRQEMFDEAWESLEKVARRMKKYANQHQ